MEREKVSERDEGREEIKNYDFEIMPFYVNMNIVRKQKIYIIGQK
jgi:hypothetical protein